MCGLGINSSGGKRLLRTRLWRNQICERRPPKPLWRQARRWVKYWIIRLFLIRNIFFTRNKKQIKQKYPMLIIKSNDLTSNNALIHFYWLKIGQLSLQKFPLCFDTNKWILTKTCTKNRLMLLTNVKVVTLQPLFSLFFIEKHFLSMEIYLLILDQHKKMLHISQVGLIWVFCSYSNLILQLPM